MEKILLYYIDDHFVTRSRFKTMFRNNRDFINIAGEDDSIEKAIINAKKINFDIFLLDLWLKSEPPVKNFKRLKEAFPDKPVVIYTGEQSGYWQREMYKAGAAAYISKEKSKDEIKVILLEVMKGNRVFSPLKENEAKRIYDIHRDAMYSLNDNEKKILQNLTDGMTSAQSAAALNLDISSIDKKLKKIRKIFKVKNNIELVKAVLTSM